MYTMLINDQSYKFSIQTPDQNTSGVFVSPLQLYKLEVI